MIMNNKGLIILVAGILFTGLVTLQCSVSSNMVTTGPGSETVALSGRLVDTLGRPASFARVYLVPVAYDPIADGVLPLAQTATTDVDGNYALSGPDSGSYNIQALQSQDLTSLLIRNIRVRHDSVFVTADTLRSSGTIRVVVPNGLDTNNGYFYIPGSTIFSWLSDNNGIVTLASIPAGVDLSMYYAVKGSSTLPQLIRDSVIVAPGGIMNIEYIGWNFSKKLILNTTASGANVAGNVMNFPVLIRLNSANFNFAEAKSGGEDVRFTKSDGTPLSYEIERWDATSQAAEVWVKIDTVYGNDSTHFINMYWGASTGSVTVSLSNGAAVFDSAQGNIGVWHLDPSLNDATIFSDNGIDSATADAVGIIGRCRHFDPALHSCITIPNESRFDITTNITLSAWVQVDSLYVGWEAIITKGDNTYRLHCDTTLKDVVFSTSTFASNQTDTVINRLYSKTRLDDRQWHFICGVFDGSAMHIYIDGILDGEVPVTSPCRVNNFKVMIGNNGEIPNRFFAGSIDEVRILHTAMSADWVTLCYMNQKGVDKLLIFK
jgi:hypothetical protein